MDERKTKRRGPLLWLAARTWRFWAALALLPILYVASSGPTRAIAFGSASVLLRPSTVSVPGTPVGLDLEYEYSEEVDFWITIYGPLEWASDHTWGAPLNWYWERFPVD